MTMDLADIHEFTKTPSKMKIMELFKKGLIGNWPQIEEGRDLNESEISQITVYLTDPIANGFWHFKAKWNSSNIISEYLEGEIEKYIANNKEIIVPFRNSELKVDFEKNPEIIQSLKNKLNNFSFMLKLFAYLRLSEQEIESDLSDYTFDSNEVILFGITDINSLKAKFNDLFSLFNDEIFYKNMETDFSNGIFKLKSGNIIVERENDFISVISLDHNSIDIIKRFLEEVHHINNAKLFRSFSPEDLVFKPYIILLKEIYINIVEGQTHQNFIEQAISEFDTGRYSSCISSIGIMSEDVLVEIYESLFREEANKSLTLGQLFDKIQKNSSDVISPNRKENSHSIDDLFDEANQLLKEKDSTPDAETQLNTIKLIRKMLNYIKEENKLTKEIAMRALNPEDRKSIFPIEIKNNFNELLKNRNAISHRSRIPIGSFEAIKTIYGIITLLLWWYDIKEKVHWEGTKEEVISNIVNFNASES